MLTIRRSVEYIIYNELKKMNNVINIDKNNTLEKMIDENNEPTWRNSKNSFCGGDTWRIKFQFYAYFLFFIADFEDVIPG